MAYKRKNMIFSIAIIWTMLIPLLAALDCGGKPFRCLDPQNFIICVDLGNGVSSSIDSFVVPCPQGTECRDTNHYECEVPPPTAQVVPLQSNLTNVTESSNQPTSVDIITTESPKSLPEISTEPPSVNVTSPTTISDIRIEVNTPLPSGQPEIVPVSETSDNYGYETTEVTSELISTLPETTNDPTTVRSRKVSINNEVDILPLMVENTSAKEHRNSFLISTAGTTEIFDQNDYTTTETSATLLPKNVSLDLLPKVTTESLPVTEKVLETNSNITNANVVTVIPKSNETVVEVQYYETTTPEILVTDTRYSSVTVINEIGSLETVVTEVLIAENKTFANSGQTTEDYFTEFSTQTIPINDVEKILGQENVTRELFVIIAKADTNGTSEVFDNNQFHNFTIQQSINNDLSANQTSSVSKIYTSENIPARSITSNDKTSNISSETFTEVLGTTTSVYISNTEVPVRIDKINENVVEKKSQNESYNDVTIVQFTTETILVTVNDFILENQVNMSVVETTIATTETNSISMTETNVSNLSSADISPSISEIILPLGNNTSLDLNDTIDTEQSKSISNETNYHEVNKQQNAESYNRTDVDTVIFNQKPGAVDTSSIITAHSDLETKSDDQATMSPTTSMTNSTKDVVMTLSENVYNASVAQINSNADIEIKVDNVSENVTVSESMFQLNTSSVMESPLQSKNISNETNYYGVKIQQNAESYNLTDVVAVISNQESVYVNTSSIITAQSDLETKTDDQATMLPTTSMANSTNDVTMTLNENVYNSSDAQSNSNPEIEIKGSDGLFQLNTSSIMESGSFQSTGSSQTELDIKGTVSQQPQNYTLSPVTENENVLVITQNYDGSGVDFINTRNESDLIAVSAKPEEGLQNQNVFNATVQSDVQKNVATTVLVSNSTQESKPTEEIASDNTYSEQPAYISNENSAFIEMSLSVNNSSASEVTNDGSSHNETFLINKAILPDISDYEVNNIPSLNNKTTDGLSAEASNSSKSINTSLENVTVSIIKDILTDQPQSNAKITKEIIHNTSSFMESESFLMVESSQIKPDLSKTVLEQQSQNNATLRTKHGNGDSLNMTLNKNYTGSELPLQSNETVQTDISQHDKEMSKMNVSYNVQVVDGTLVSKSIQEKKYFNIDVITENVKVEEPIDNITQNNVYRVNHDEKSQITHGSKTNFSYQAKPNEQRNTGVEINSSRGKQFSNGNQGSNLNENNSDALANSELVRKNQEVSVGAMNKTVDVQITPIDDPNILNSVQESSANFTSYGLLNSQSMSENTHSIVIDESRKTNKEFNVTVKSEVNNKEIGKIKGPYTVQASGGSLVSKPIQGNENVQTVSNSMVNSVSTTENVIIKEIIIDNKPTLKPTYTEKTIANAGSATVQDLVRDKHVIVSPLASQPVGTDATNPPSTKTINKINSQDHKIIIKDDFNALNNVNTSKTVSLSTSTIKTIENVTNGIRPIIKASRFPIDCKVLNRGRYSDKSECRKFYICVGTVGPIQGLCPQNTVFSEIKKQCTRNLSHCIRENKFQCVATGRFSDLFDESIYYICAKNRVGKFLRFKLQCDSNYYLDKNTIKCTPKIKTTNIETKSVTSDDKSSKSESNSEVQSSVNQSLEVDSEFECHKIGKFPIRGECRKYYQCYKKHSKLRKRTKKCDSDEIFHKDKKKCVDAESYECEYSK